MTSTSQNVPCRKVSFGSRAAISLVAGLVGAAFWFTGCGGDQAEDPVVLEVNGREFRVSELQAQVDHLRTSGSAVLRDPEAFLETYVERQVALEAARQQGLDEDPELKRQWENLLIGRLRQNALEDAFVAISISDAEVEAYYAEQLEDYTTPARMRVALLRLEVDPLAALGVDHETARSKMETARIEAEQLPADSKGFGALAMRYSDEGTSRFKGGDIGWLQAGRAQYRWPDAVVEALFALSPEAPLSPVIESGDAVYLLKYMDHRPERVRSLDDSLFQSIQRNLYAQAQARVRESMESEWRAQFAVEINRDAASLLNFNQTEFQMSDAEDPQPIPFQ